ncbi:CheR family methyltransferase [Enterococcus bulliens]
MTNEMNDFNAFNQWVASELNIQLSDYKENQMQRRILSLMTTKGVHTLNEYQQKILADREIRQEFIEHLTINVTEFYRNRELFEIFEKNLLKEIVPNFSKIKIWSAACSNGSEPYTLAMIADKHRLKKITILATDLDDKILARAKEGIYRENEVKNLSFKDKQAYFQLIETKRGPHYQVNPAVRQNITFKKHDLLLDPYPRQCQVIVCRNVTIYFKVEARDKVYQRFSQALVPGGLLFTGATETINFPERIGLKKIDSFIYQKTKE